MDGQAQMEWVKEILEIKSEGMSWDPGFYFSLAHAVSAVQIL
jgi:hypothetical protein